MTPMVQGAILAFAVGLLVGSSYFVGLWMTVRRLPWARRPFVLLALSAAVRLSLLLGAIYLVTDGRWERLAACVLGVLTARTVLLVLRGRAPRAAKS